MSASRSFVDTNVILYAHDATAGEKRRQARDIMRELWDSGEGSLSVQVMQEFFVNVTRKLPRPLDAATAADILSDLARWHVHAPVAGDVLAAVEIHRREGISLWDAMVVRSAAQLGCEVLYSEDLSHGQRYAGVRVENPFATS